MSWVERYGIVGTYFFLFFGGLCISIFGVPKIEITAGIVSIIIALCFPVGYFLISMGQLFYYGFDRHPWRLDLDVIKNIISKKDEIGLTNKEKILNEISKINTQLEAEVFTVKSTRIKKEGDKNENIQEWMSKRNYVIAINSAVILTIIIGWFVCLCVFISNGFWMYYTKEFLYIFLSSFIIFLALSLQNQLLTKLNVNILCEYVLYSLKLDKKIRQKRKNLNSESK